MVSKFLLLMAVFVLGFCLVAAIGKKVKNPVVPTGFYDFDYPAYFGNRLNIPPDNPITKQGVYLGRMLFYETKLSSNNKVSCATCHQQKLAFTDGKSFSTGVGAISTARNSMSLANLLRGRSFFWDGRVKSLEEQGLFPLLHPDEMGSSMESTLEKLQRTAPYPALFRLAFDADTITADFITKALSQFERTLISCHSIYDQYLQGKYTPTESEKRGIALFFGNGEGQARRVNLSCGHCHGGPRTVTETFHNNGLDSIPKDIGREKLTGLASDKGRFRVPTLRNIALTAPYMHDGRFQSLNEVVDHYSEHIKASDNLSTFLQPKPEEKKRIHPLLSEQEKQDIVAFLHLLTDSSFISDPRFSDPHIH